MMPFKSIFLEKLHDFSPSETAAIFSAMQLNVDLQSSLYRLEKAVYICLSFCKGTKKPDLDLIQFILDKLESLGVSMMEDPAEDIYSSALWFQGVSYKVCTGLWEGGIYQAQVFLNGVECAPDSGEFVFIKNRIKAILSASDIVLSNNYIDNNKIGGRYPVDEINVDELVDLNTSVSAIDTGSDSSFDLLPKFNIGSDNNLYEQELGESDLELSPFVISDNKTLLILPTAIIACLKRQIIDFIRTRYSNDFLDMLFYGFLAKSIYSTRLLREFHNLPIKFQEVKDVNGWMFFECSVEFDDGYWFHFLFFGESFKKLGSAWFNTVSGDESVSKYLAKSIERAKNHHINDKSAKKGCSIVIACSYGQPMAIGIPFVPDDKWMVSVQNIHDLDCLSHDLDCTPHRVWRFIESENQLTETGAKIVNPNGFLNLYAYAKKNNYSLISHEDFQQASTQPSSVLLHMGSNFHAELREKVLQDSSSKIIKHPNLGLIEVNRGFGGSLFSCNEKYDVYIPKKIDKGLFQAVYLKGGIELWIEQKNIENITHSLQIELFKASLSWIEKIITTCLEEGMIIPDELRIWQISYQIPDDHENIKKPPAAKHVLESYSNNLKTPTLYSKFSPIFIRGLNLEDNVSEQALILSFLSIVCKANEYVDINAVLTKVIESKDARHIHSFVGNDFLDFVTDDIDEAIIVEQIDEQNTKINLGWACKKRETGNLIEGKEDCKKYLNCLVSHIWDLIKTKLECFEREDIIIKLLANTANSEHDKRRWERTFKANLALHDDAYSVVGTYVQLLSVASLASRLVIEMAICECPEGDGEKAGVLDIQELMSLATLIHHLGGLSESINYEAVAPKLVISIFGDVLFEHDFNDQVLEPYAKDVYKSGLSSQADSYSENLVLQKHVQETNSLFGGAFLTALKDEFGFSVDEVRSFLDLIEDYGHKLNKAVYTCTVKDLLTRCDESKRDLTENIINELSIYSRDSWTSIPTPFKKTDWQPWRFRRRFSIALRPIIKLSNDRLVVAPHSIRKSFIYLIRLCHSASLDENHFSSKSMKKWIGNTRKTNGLLFNTTVANKLEELGWLSKEEIKLTEVLNKKLKKDFGDIDVFAWHEESNTIVIIECKDLEYAKTQGEIARQLFDFKGLQNKKGKMDRLLKHVQRLKVLEGDISGVAKFIGSNDPINLKAYVVFSNDVPMIKNTNRQFLDEVEFVSYDMLDNIFSI